MMKDFFKDYWLQAIGLIFITGCAYTGIQLSNSYAMQRLDKIEARQDRLDGNVGDIRISQSRIEQKIDDMRGILRRGTSRD